MTLPTPLLDRIQSPADVRALSRPELKQLATEVRDYLLRNVARTGGHLSSNLGTVELTIALHHVFDTPDDRLVWDVGHQTYPHKILTGRRDRIHTVKQADGIAPSPMMATQWRLSPLSCAPSAMPSAAEIEVEECAVPKVSYSLSSRLGKPDRPPAWRSVGKRSLRPVRILCG